MKLHHLLLTIALACASPLTLQAQTPDESLVTAAKRFCTTLRAEPIEGLPSVAQFQRLSPLLTKELIATIERARVIQREQVRKHPDEKPDWIEGDLFSSQFEGVTTWELGSAFSAHSVDATVKVRHTYVEEDQPTNPWIDTLIFKQQHNAWCLDDIIMGGGYAFESAQTLRGRLPGGLKETKDHDSLDERWHIEFKRHADTVTYVTLTDLKGKAKPLTLFGDAPDDACPFGARIVWSPNCDMLALYCGDSVRFTNTRVFRLTEGIWKRVALPSFYPEERKTMANNGFREDSRIIEPAHWQDANTLVVHYFGQCTKGGEGDGMDKLISVRIANGKASIVGALDTPGDN